jgi:transposase
LNHEPEEIIDAEHELVIERVAAIDVAKASGKVCVRLPGKSGRRVSRVWDVAATSGAVADLAAQLLAQRVQRVTVESTSDYWRIWFYLLEAAGLDVQLVNAREVKNVPGRPKTDKLDAVWLAKLTDKGMLRPSFVPPQPIRQLRDYTRLRTDLTHDRSRQVQRLEKLLEDALIKLSTVATDITGVSGRAIIEALIAGQRDPKLLAELARGRMKAKRAALVDALTGRFDDHHAELARMLLDQIDALTGQIDTLTARIEEHIGALSETPTIGDGPDADDQSSLGAPRAGDRAARRDRRGDGVGLTTIERLDEIPGIGPTGAQIILAEIGTDMTRFPTPAHLVSWAKLCPRTIQSGPITRGGRTGKGNPYLKGVLGDAASAAAKTNTFLGERYRRIVKRRGKLKALVAVARSILVVVWHLRRPHRPLPRPRRRLPHQPPRHPTTRPQPHRPTHGPRLPGHPRTRCLDQLHNPATSPGPAGCSRLPTHPGNFSDQTIGTYIASLAADINRLPTAHDDLRGRLWRELCMRARTDQATSVAEVRFGVVVELEGSGGREGLQHREGAAGVQRVHRERVAGPPAGRLRRG